MGIVARMLRLCKADLHGLLDQIEDRELLLKQFLREMEAALVQTKTTLEGLNARKKRIAHDLSSKREGIRAIEEDIAHAVSREKDDIARALIRRAHPMRKAAVALEARLKQLRHEIDAVEATYARQSSAYAKICCRAAGGVSQSALKADVPSWRHGPEGPGIGPGEAEIELELLRYKELLETGRAS